MHSQMCKQSPSRTVRRDFVTAIAHCTFGLSRDCSKVIKCAFKIWILTTNKNWPFLMQNTKLVVALACPLSKSTSERTTL